MTVLLLVAVSTQVLNIKPVFADTGGYPWATASCVDGTDCSTTYNWGYSLPCPQNDTNCLSYPYPSPPATPTAGMGDLWSMGVRNCTSYVAWKLNQVFNQNIISGSWGSAYQWDSYALAHSYSNDSSPQVGDIAQWGSEVGHGYGHVAYVWKVESNGVADLYDFNSGYPLDGSGHPTWGNFDGTHTSASNASSHTPDHYIHIGNASNSSNTVLEVKKLTASDGTNEVIWSKATDVDESWWNSSSNGIQVGNLLHISQGDIKSFDISLYSNGEHDLFTATTNNIWETWWYPGQGLHTTEILTNIGNIHKIIKSIGSDGVTQQLYVLTDTGAYEYWWNSGSNGIQHDTIMTLANPVDEYKEIESDGTQALFVADQNYPYELHWGSGINGIQQTTFASVSGITSISYSRSSDGKHRLYVGASSGAIWEATWYTGGSIGYWYMTGGVPVVSIQKWEDDSEQVLYEATASGVLEYYWPTTSNTLSSDTIVSNLSNVHSFVRSTDPGGVQSVYTATGTDIDESWWIPGGNGITTGTIE